MGKHQYHGGYIPCKWLMEYVFFKMVLSAYKLDHDLDAQAAACISQAASENQGLGESHWD